ncbi:hypothetical protein [Rhizobium sp. LjRoot254]|uniref:hypothetical protein n=1 Tax=Rhizobium sp. LjRoot254 TaxID=3342297 RepID=UPI003ECFB99B
MNFIDQQMAAALCEQVYRRSGTEQQLLNDDEAFGDPLDAEVRKPSYRDSETGISVVEKLGTTSSQPEH